MLALPLCRTQKKRLVRLDNLGGQSHAKRKWSGVIDISAFAFIIFVKSMNKVRLRIQQHDCNAVSMEDITHLITNDLGDRPDVQSLGHRQDLVRAQHGHLCQCRELLQR